MADPIRASNMGFVLVTAGLHAALVLEGCFVAVLEAGAVVGYGRAFDRRVDVEVGHLRVDGAMGELVELRGFDAVAIALLGLFGARRRGVPILLLSGRVLILIPTGGLGVDRRCAREKRHCDQRRRETN